MNKERPSVTLRPKEEIRIVRGHPWIYDNEIRSAEGEPKPGELVDCRDARGRVFARGWYNPDSKIRVRVVTRGPEAPGPEYVYEAAKASIERRKLFYDVERESLRLVFGEADGLPGLIADQYVDRESGARHLSLQLLSRGAAEHRAEIVAALERLVRPASIYERSDASVLKLEGLTPYEGQLSGVTPERVIMAENGLSFAVDLKGGQKTGWFLDQRENRAAVARYAKGRRCIDAFSHAGGFALALAAAGAESVTAIDVSGRAVACIAENARLNGLDGKAKALEADCFDALRDLEKSGRGAYDLIVLDPPAFAKTKSAREGAGRGYKEINLRAMRMLPPGGILATCSCSYALSREAFYEMLEYAANDAGRRFEILEQRAQAFDHPIVSGYRESFYLKCAILRLL